jgi:two-component system, NarL family, response regulator DevR
METNPETPADETSEHSEHGSTPDALTARELAVLRLVAHGQSNDEIAAELAISSDTVKFHVKNIYRKLGVASRAEATWIAARRGWFDD